MFYFKTNKPQRFFWAQYQLYSKVAGHLRGEHTPCILPPEMPLAIIMHQVVAYKKLKTVENNIIVRLKSGRICSSMVAIAKGF